MREPTPEERALFEWVLPVDRPGYREVLEHIRGWNVAAKGRRGEGHWILAPAGSAVDHESPLPQVLALGTIVHAGGDRSILVREFLGEQLDFEVTGTPSGPEQRRWTLSSWSPGAACPQCGESAREVAMSTAGGSMHVLAICSADRRLWVHEAKTGVNHPVPVTLYYSELMRHTGMKDPVVALASSRLFEQTGTFADADLVRAFTAYNDIRAKVSTGDRIVPPEVQKGFFRRVLSLFTRRA